MDIVERLWRAFESEETDRKDGAIKSAADEIEKLREGIRKLETVHRQRNEWGDRMMAENERLREALRDIYDLEPDIHYPDWYQRAACSIARAALGEGKE